MNLTAQHFLRGALVAVGALACMAAVLATAERAAGRAEASAIGRLVGAAPVAGKLAAIGNRVSTHEGSPSAADLAWVREMAAARPLSPLPYYIVGGSTRDRPQARALMKLALLRDPRLRPAHLWQFDDRLEANDVGNATRALIRLAVLSPTDQRLMPLLAQMAAIPEARAVIKEYLARGVWWREGFLSTLSASEVDRAVVFDMFQVGAKPGAPPPPGGLTASNDRKSFIAAMMSRGDYERAYLAWLLWLPDASQDATGYVFDGNFKGRQALPPFAWELSNGAGGSLTIDAATGLSVDYSGSDGNVLAKQAMLLPPGRYHLVTDVNFQPVSNENGTAALLWRITCLPSATVLKEVELPLTGKPARLSSAPFDVDSACAAQTLTLEVNSSEFAKHLSGTIRSVSIETAN